MFLYFIEAGEGGPIKIGISKNIEKRLSSLQSGNYRKLKVLQKFTCTNEQTAKKYEQRLHERFKHTGLKGEWFMPTAYMHRVIGKIYEKDGELYEKDYDPIDEMVGARVYSKIADYDHGFQQVAIDFAEDGDFWAVEHIIGELKETIKIIKQDMDGVRGKQYRKQIATGGK